jgi:hypothetical protein
MQEKETERERKRKALLGKREGGKKEVGEVRKQAKKVAG